MPNIVEWRQETAKKCGSNALSLTSRYAASTILAVAVQLLAPGLSSAESSDSFPIHIDFSKAFPSSTFCGSYCLKACSDYYGRRIALENLFSSRYHTGDFGSSVDDIVRCAKENDLAAIRFSNASLLDLWILHRPMLLLVKDSPTSVAFSHWIVAVDVSLDRVRVFDPSSGDLDIEPGELMSLWGGVGVLILPPDDVTLSLALWIGATVSAMFSLLGLVACVLGLTRLLVGKRTWMLIPIASLLIASASYALTPKKVSTVSLRERPGGAETSDRVATYIFPEELLRPNIGDSAAPLILDVRLPHSFASGHVQGAINAPLGLSHFALQKLLEPFPRDVEIVIYCESEGCPWADHVAARAEFSLFTHVRVLKGGMDGYRKAIEK